MYVKIQNHEMLLKSNVVKEDYTIPRPIGKSGMEMKVTPNTLSLHHTNQAPLLHSNYYIKKGEIARLSVLAKPEKID